MFIYEKKLYVFNRLHYFVVFGMTVAITYLWKNLAVQPANVSRCYRDHKIADIFIGKLFGI
jgi:hypothetical protein